MNPKESIIRDKLAANLQQIESGLKLCAIELRVENPHGASGKIDIFAEDRFKNKIIIELKRSDEASRQAVHELLKYTELLRDQHGLKPSQIRVILISTDWNELLVPFSALTREVAFPCEGYRINVDINGNIKTIKKIEILKEAHLLDFIPHHMVYGFSTPERRILQIPVLCEKMAKNGIKDFVFFSLDYAGQNKRVIAPFTLYICLGTVTTDRATEIFKTLGVLEEVEEYFENAEESEFDFFQYQIMEQVFGTFSIDCDDFGIGYPEKAGHLANDWSLISADRFGKWKNSEKIYSDADLWAQVSAFTGKNLLVFKKTTSPRFAAAWNECKTKADGALIGYSPWQKIYRPYLDDIEKQHPNASISVSIFNPVDLLFQLYSFVAKQEICYIPHFQIEVEDLTKSYRSIAISSWTWDGVTKPPPPKKILTEMFGEPFNYIMCRHLGMLDQYYENLLRIHGFSMPILEIQKIAEAESGFLLNAENDQLIRTSCSISHPPGLGLLAFLESNHEYMQKLIEFVDEYTTGLD